MSSIKFKDVTKVFPNGYIGLEEVSFEIEPATLTYITGESGAGKTTLMRLLIREISPTQGDIYLGESNILELPNTQIPNLRRRVGVVFQDYQLIPDRTIFENVSLILEIIGVKPKEIKRQAQDVLELVGLPDKKDLFPVQLSGGELQRTAIARALITAPEVLYADEPTGNLDKDTSFEILDLLQKIQDLGTTVVVATHDHQILEEYPSRQIILKQGKVIEQKESSQNKIKSK